MDENSHPFYLHAIRKAFLCVRGREIVGRVVAIKDHLHNEHYQDSVGFFGFFEVIEDKEVAQALIGASSAWLAEQGCTSIRGPVSPSMKGEFGVVVQGNDDPPFVMMGYSPKYYEELLLGCDFNVAREFNAYLYDVPSQREAVMNQEDELRSVTDKVLQRYPQLKVVGVSKQTLERELRRINVLANQVRSQAWGFVPLTDAELDFMVKQMQRVLKPEQLLVAYWEDKLVGYCINVQCVNWALRQCFGRHDWVRLPQFLYWIGRSRRTRVIGLGAHEDYRKKGVGVLLSSEMRYRGTRDTQYEQWEFLLGRFREPSFDTCDQPHDAINSLQDFATVRKADLDLACAFEVFTWRPGQILGLSSGIGSRL